MGHGGASRRISPGGPDSAQVHPASARPNASVAPVPGADTELVPERFAFIGITRWPSVASVLICPSAPAARTSGSASTRSSRTFASRWLNPQFVTGSGASVDRPDRVRPVEGMDEQPRHVGDVNPAHPLPAAADDASDEYRNGFASWGNTPPRRPRRHRRERSQHEPGRGRVLVPRPHTSARNPLPGRSSSTNSVAFSRYMP